PQSAVLRLLLAAGRAAPTAAASADTYPLSLHDALPIFDTAGYVRFLAQHYFVYQSLEAAADLMRTDPIAGPFVDDALHRTSALAADLEYLLGPDWARQIEPSPATRDYQTRIDEVKHVPAWFIAHHYTRCLGDLSRGLLVSDAMTKAYGGPDGAGTAFFRYDAIRDPQ